MTVIGEASYLPRGGLWLFEEEDQPAGESEVWVRIHRVPLAFERDADAGRWWATVEGTRIAGDGNEVGPVEIRVWLSALPLHEPTPEDPMHCDRCDPPKRWPCPPARARLLAEYEGQRDRLARYLARHLCAAGRPGSPETARQAYDRIVGWTWDGDARDRLAIR